MTATWLAAWAGGASPSFASPFGHPAQWVGPGTPGPDRALVVVGDDVRAVAAAEALGGRALVQAFDRETQEQALRLPPRGPAIVVTSVDSLQAPSIRGLLQQRTPGLPVCLWGADSWQSDRPGHRGRGAHVPRLLAAAGLGPTLTVWRDPRGRDAIDEAPPGVLRLTSAAGFAAESARGDRGTAWPVGGLAHRLGEAGLSSRRHVLGGVRARVWQEFDRALRKEDVGFDLVERPVGGLPDRFGASLGAGSVMDLLVPGGGALVFGDGPRTAATTTARSIRGAAREAGDWLVFPGGDPVALEDAVTAGLLTDLRSTLLAGRLADSRRFRSPFIDRDPDQRRLHEAYAQALSDWSLAQRAALFLTDRGDRDLVALALALAVEPAWLSDVLGSLDRDGLVAIELHALDGAVDWQARRGPAWGDGEGVEAEFEAAANRRREECEAVAALRADPRCRSVALRDLLDLEPGEACGACDRCSDAWRWELGRRAGGSAGVGAGFFDSLRQSPPAAAEALFGGALAGAPPPVSAQQRLRDAAPDALGAVVAELGGPGAALAAACLRLRQPHGPSVELPSELIDPTLAALREVARPAGMAAQPSAGFGARWLRSDLLELTGPPGRWAGAQRVSVGGDLDSWLERLAALDLDLGGLRADRAAAALWPAAVAGRAERLTAFLAAHGGLPGADTLAPTVSLPRGGAWTAASKAWAGEPTEVPPDLTDAGLLRLLLAAQRGDWSAVHQVGPLGEPWDTLRERAVLGLEPPPAVEPSRLATWLGGQPPPRSDFDRLLEVAAPGSREDWMALIQAVGRRGWPTDPVVERATALGRLPGRVRDLLLPGLLAGDPAGAARTLQASVDDLQDLQAVLKGLVPEHGVAALLELPATGWLAEAQEGLGRQAERSAALRRSARTAGAAGDLAAAAQALLELGRLGLRGSGWGDDHGLAELEAAVAAAQQRYASPLAAALAGGDEEGGRRALAAAHADGWLEPLLGVLRAQVRRHEHDPDRRRWLALGLAQSRRWPQARLELDVAAAAWTAEEHAEAALDVIEQALAHDAGGFALRWLADLGRGRPSLALGRGIAMLAWGKKLPSEGREPLINALEAQGTGAYAGAIRALRGDR